MSAPEQQESKSRPGMEDLLFGLFLVALSVVVFVATRKLRVGTASEMGPAYYPRTVAWCVLGFGAFFVGRSFVVPGTRIKPPHWRALLLVSAAVAVFALLVTRAGLALASFASMVIVSLASKETRLVEVIVFSAVVSAGCVLLFVKALSLPVPIFPW